MPRSPWWPAAAAVGLGLAPSLADGLQRFSEAGLAWLAVAALGAALLGVPLATWEWRQEREQHDGPRHRLDHGTSLTLGTLAAGALLGEAAHALGTPWLVLALAAATALLPRFPRVPWVAAGLTVPLIAMAAGFVETEPVGPWTLLEPRWTGWTDWAPRALVAGVCFAAPGLGLWSRVRTPVPGTLRTVWMSVGAALLTSLALGVLLGVRYESLALTTVGWLPLLGGLLAAIALQQAPPQPSRRPWHGLGVLASAAFFAGPGQDGLALFWASTLPLGLALVQALRAWQQPDHRGLVASAAAVLAVCGLLGWPGLPASAAGAGSVALVWVALVWGPGTWAVLGRRP